MRIRKTLEMPQEPISEVPEEEPRQVRLKRYFWVLSVVVLLSGILYWISLNSQPKANAPEVFSQGENSPDGVIDKLHLVSTVLGLKRWELYADGARVYQSQKLAYADNIYAQFYKKEKLTSTLTADKAIINTETNATEAQGHVELIVENGSKLETEKLNWNPDTDQIKTDGFVHVYKGEDDITAIGMVADTQLNNIRFSKDVHTQMRDKSEIENFSKPKPF